jgi:N-glycosidase YbiA
MAIWFYSKSPDYGWLSNFSEYGFKLDGVRWASVEHYYQAQKYAGTDVAERIRKADSPLKARKAGQDRSLSVRQDWEGVKEEVMRQAIRAKFDQNRKLRELLLATADEELLHESNSDLFWGRNRDGAGDNRLGVILMDIRQGLRGGHEESD